MYEHILVPLDQSVDSEKALAAAVGLAKQLGSRLTLCVVVTPLGPPDQTDVVRLGELGVQRALAYLEKRSEESRTAGVVNTDIEARQGDPAESILEIAATRNVDLIAMSSHGLGRAYKYPLGSVALRVLMTAPCPVLTIRTSPSISRP